MKLIEQAEKALALLKSLAAMSKQDDATLRSYYKLVPVSTGAGALHKLQIDCTLVQDGTGKEFAPDYRVRYLAERSVNVPNFGPRWKVIAEQWDDAYQRAWKNVLSAMSRQDAEDDAMDELHWNHGKD